MDEIRLAPTVRVIRTRDEIEEIQEAWTAWRGARDADIDVYRTCLHSVWDRAEPYIIVIERSGQPDAILIGTKSRSSLLARIGYLRISVPRARVLRFVYDGFLGNQSKENGELIVSKLEQTLRRGEADVAILSYVREDTHLHQLATHLRSISMREHFSVSVSHSLMTLPGSPEALYAQLSAQHGRSLRRDSRRFHAAFADLEVSRRNGTDQLEALFEDVERIAATTYQRGLRVGFSDSRPVHELLSLEAKKGWLRAYVLYANGQPCAFWIGCVYNNMCLSEYLGYDPSYAKHSPGNYLLTYVMEDLCREGVSAIDFGIGDAPYKRRFGHISWQEREIYLYAPTFKGMQAKAVRTAAGFVKLVSKKTLKGTNFEARLKRFWRNRVAPGN